MTDEKKSNDSQTDSPEKPAVIAEEAMENLGEMLKQFGAQKREAGDGEKAEPIRVNLGDAGPLPEMMLNLFSAAVSQAQNTRSSSTGSEGRPASDEQPDVVSLDEERQKRAADSPREPTELEKKLRENVGGSFSRYMRENVDEQDRKGGSIPLDGPFLKKHGAPLLGAVLKSFAETVLPEDGKVSIPVPGKEGESPTNLTLDVGNLLGSVRKDRESTDTSDE